MEYLVILISAVLVNNIVLAQFLGICPFIGVSKSIDTAIGMGAAVLFVLTLSTLVTFMIHHMILVPLHIEFMRTVTFILVIAALVQMVEIMMKQISPTLYQALGVFLPLITTNCAVFGVAILVIQKEFNFLETLVFAIASAIGFAIALVIFAGIRERLELVEIPEGMKGAPVALVTAGILSLAFMGFSGLV